MKFGVVYYPSTAWRECESASQAWDVFKNAPCPETEESILVLYGLKIPEKYETCDLNGSYFPKQNFNWEGLEEFRPATFWLGLGQQVTCTAEVVIGGSGGAGASRWEDSLVLFPGDSMLLTRIGNPSTPSRVLVFRK